MAAVSPSEQAPSTNIATPTTAQETIEDKKQKLTEAFNQILASLDSPLNSPLTALLPDSTNLVVIGSILCKLCLKSYEAKN